MDLHHLGKLLLLQRLLMVRHVYGDGQCVLHYVGEELYLLL